MASTAVLTAGEQRPRYALRPALTSTGAILAAAAIGCVTAFVRLGAQPLSWDEAVTSNAAHRSLPELWHLLGHTDAPLGAYYFLLNAWARLLGSVGITASEGWLRVPSAVAAVAAVACTARLGARMFGPVTGLVAGTLLAVHPLFVFYAHDARPYAIAVLLVVAATDLLLDAVERPTTARLSGYAAVATAALYMQLLTVFVLVAHGVYAYRSGVRRRRLAVVALAIVLAVAPLVAVAHGQTGEIGWIPTPSLPSLVSFLVRIAGGVAVAVCLAALCAVGCRPVRGNLRRLFRRDPTGNRLLLVAAWVVVPVVGIAAASVVQPVLLPRYALACVPAIALGCAVLVRRVPRSARRGLLAALAVTGLISSGVQLAQPYKYEDYRAAADAVLDAAHHGDAMVFVPSSFRVGMVPYLRADHDDRNPVVPVDVALADPASPFSGDVIGGVEYSPVGMTARVAGADRVFLIGDALAAAASARPGSVDRAVADLLTQGYADQWRESFGGVTVTLLVRR